MKFQSLALVQCCQWMFKNNKLFERNITSFWFWCAHFFQLILVSFLSSLIAPFLQISVLFILWVIHVCSDLRLHGFEGEGLGGLRIRVHWGRLRYEIKEDDIPFPPFSSPLPSPFLTMIKIQGLLRSPLIVSWSCKNRQEKRLSLTVICTSYRSSQCYWPMERRVFSSQHSLQ